MHLIATDVLIQAAVIPPHANPDGKPCAFQDGAWVVDYCPTDHEKVIQERAWNAGLRKGTTTAEQLFYSMSEAEFSAWKAKRQAELAAQAEADF